MRSAEPVAPPRVGLVTQDLMVRSKVESLLTPLAVGGTLVGDEPSPGPFDLLLVDLNRNAADRLAWLERVASSGPGGEVICFGPHTEMAELTRRARAAGATRCVANSHLPETLQRWRRTRGGAAR